MSRIYFHVDLNAFFANAEVLRDPSLKGKPLVVSGQTRRSVVSTASYEARAYGVHSAMPIGEAQKLCKDLVIVEGHYAYYRELSKQFMDIIREYATKMEQASIDECYADVTECIMKYPKPLDLAWLIQKRVLKEVGLSCSIGVGPNLFLAKMASDMKKPLGITILRIRDVKDKMWPLPIGDMFGIGKKTQPLLEDIGIFTIGDLAQHEANYDLKQILGKNTEELIARANGYDNSEMIEESESKSMGISETLLEDVTDYDELRGLIRSLSKELSMRLKKSNKVGTRISIRICYYNFRNVDRSHKCSEPLYKETDIFQQALLLFDQNWNEGEAVRLLGVSVSDFMNEDTVKQLDLFHLDTKDEEIRAVINDLNKLVGTKTFVKASTLLKGKKS